MRVRHERSMSTCESVCLTQRPKGSNNCLFMQASLMTAAGDPAGIWAGTHSIKTPKLQPTRASAQHICPMGYPKLLQQSQERHFLPLLVLTSRCQWSSSASADAHEQPEQAWACSILGCPWLHAPTKPCRRFQGTRQGMLASGGPGGLPPCHSVAGLDLPVYSLQE